MGLCKRLLREAQDRFLQVPALFTHLLSNLRTVLVKDIVDLGQILGRGLGCWYWNLHGRTGNVVDRLPFEHARLARQIFDVGLRGRLRTLLLLYLQLLGVTSA